MTRACHNLLGHDEATCPVCKLARNDPRYRALWTNGVSTRPRRQIDPDKPRLPKGVPP